MTLKSRLGEWTWPQGFRSHPRANTGMPQTSLGIAEVVESLGGPTHSLSSASTLQCLALGPQASKSVSQFPQL